MNIKKSIICAVVIYASTTYTQRIPEHLESSIHHVLEHMITIAQQPHYLVNTTENITDMMLHLIEAGIELMQVAHIPIDANQKTIEQAINALDPETKSALAAIFLKHADILHKHLATHHVKRGPAAEEPTPWVYTDENGSETKFETIEQRNEHAESKKTQKILGHIASVAGSFLALARNPKDPTNIALAVSGALTGLINAICEGCRRSHEHLLLDPYLYPQLYAIVYNKLHVHHTQL